MNQDALIIVFVTVPDRNSAEQLAQELVTERLAACVSILPNTRSVYRWKGAIETAEEVLLLIKTQHRIFPQLEAQIRTRHPYEVPEIVALKIEAVNEAYQSWVSVETSPTSPTRP